MWRPDRRIRDSTHTSFVKGRQMTTHSFIIVTVAAGAALLGCAAAASADGYVRQGPFVTAAPGPFLPGPTAVPGKELSTLPDRNATPAHANYAMQVIRWDGVGGTYDGFDFDASDEPEGRNVDALAADSDLLFYDVIANQSHLLFTTEGETRILAELTSGAWTVWATQPQIDHAGVGDGIDALEVWGSEPANPGDAQCFSLQVLPGVAETAAVYHYFSGNVTTLVTTSQIASAIGRPDLAQLIDLDGLMIDAPLALQNTFEAILFSIRPIDVFDGGEIWVWDGDPTHAANFLSHGGHVWNTAFDVMGTFNTASENVIALEAVSSTEIPEPAACAMALAAMALLVAAGGGRRTLGRDDQ